MKVLVTGGSGLIGRYVADELSVGHQVTILDLKDPHRHDLPFLRIDLCDEQAVRAAVTGFDQVVHLAGIPHPLNHPAEVVYRTNTQTTYNLLEACAASSVKKFVFISSESTLGFAFSSSRMWPLRVPIDESHPLRPQDPYGLSKVACEIACEGFTRRTGMRTVCLRPPWIWVPEPKEAAFYRTLVAEHHHWSRSLWANIHVRDVAQAVRLALERDLPEPHERLFICADENWTGKDSRALLAEFYPECRQVDDAWTGAASFLNSGRAQKLLGFRPTGTTAEILKSHD